MKVAEELDDGLEGKGITGRIEEPGATVENVSLSGLVESRWGVGVHGKEGEGRESCCILPPRAEQSDVRATTQLYVAGWSGGRELSL